MTKIENYINGNKVSFSNNYLPVFDPSTGDKISEVVLSNKKDFDNVLNSSKKHLRVGLILPH